jgi:hypothetical protein
MGNRAAVVPLLFAVALFGAAFLLTPASAHAGSRDSLARGILEMVTQRLCDRQAALGWRGVHLIHPSKCAPTPPPPVEPTVTLTANPTTIAAGESATLTWTSTNATSCTAFLGWSGSKPLNGSASVSPTETTTYQLDCTGPGGVGSDDALVTVTVEEPEDPTVEITADPMTITAGSSTTLTWNSENADSCTASNGWSGSKALDDDESVSPTVTTTYTITCDGDGGSASDSVTVTVNQPEPEDPTLDLTANPSTITEGSSSLLSWSTTNATSCEKSGGWSGATTTSGTFSVSPTATTTYSMECTGAGGTVSDSVTVNVVLTPEEPDAPTVDLVAAPTTVDENSAGNATTTLTWTTTNATSCTASGGTFAGPKATSSSEVLTPTATTTYMLECVGDGGTTTDSVTVNFVPEPGEPEPTVGHILISEVLDQPEADGPHGADTTNEWIELYNPTASPVDLSFWSIIDLTTNADIIPEGTSIPAGGFLILTNASTTAGLWGGMNGVQVIAFESPLGSALNNTSEALFLRNAATTTIDSLSWGSNTTGFVSGSGAPDVVPGHSLARSALNVDTGIAADWFDDTTPSPGLVN